MSRITSITLNPCIDKTITIEKLNPYGLNRVISSRSDPGGKGINVAMVLKDFGVDVTVAGFIAGAQGRIITKYLKEKQIKYDFLETDGETRTNLKIIDESIGKTTEINEAGFFVSEETLSSFKQKFESLMRVSEIAVLCGSIPPGVPANIYAECIKTAKSYGVKVILDADGAALSEGLKAAPYAVKPNIYELTAYMGHKLTSINEIGDAAKRLISSGTEIVIVSMGAEGAVVADRNVVYKTVPWSIRERSATGAGDSMVGALACSVLRGDSLYNTAKMATAAGTVTASKEGTQICGIDEVLGSVEKVSVTEITL